MKVFTLTYTALTPNYFDRYLTLPRLAAKTMVTRPLQSYRLSQARCANPALKTLRANSVPLELPLSDFLVRNGLVHYCDVFQQHGITLAVLAQLSDAHYQAMGVPPSVQFYVKQQLQCEKGQFSDW